jgi:hypothetical protein
VSRPVLAFVAGLLLLPASAVAQMDGDYGGHTTTCGTVSFHHHAGRITNITTGPYSGLFPRTGVDDRGAFSATSEDFGVFHGRWVSPNVVQGHYYYRPPRDDNYPRWRAYLHVAPVPGHYRGDGVSFSVASGQVVDFRARNGTVSVASLPLHRNGFATFQELQAACGSWSGTEVVRGYYRAGRAYGNHPVAYEALRVSD